MRGLLVGFAIVITMELGGASSVATAQDSASRTSFCQQRYFREDNGKLYCNWGRNLSEACTVTSPANKSVEKDAVIEGPTDAGKCSSSQKVVKLVHK